jgi:hypothetical protein
MPVTIDASTKGYLVRCSYDLRPPSRRDPFPPSAPGSMSCSIDTSPDDGLADHHRAAQVLAAQGRGYIFHSHVRVVRSRC